MKKLLVAIILVGLIFSLPLFAMGEDSSKEVLTLKRDLAQERVLRLQSQLSLMQQQFADGQKYLQEVTKELNELNAKLKEMEPKVEKPKVEEKKK